MVATSSGLVAARRSASVERSAACLSRPSRRRVCHVSAISIGRAPREQPDRAAPPATQRDQSQGHFLDGPPPLPPAEGPPGPAALELLRRAGAAALDPTPEHARQRVVSHHRPPGESEQDQGVRDHITPALTRRKKSLDSYNAAR